MKTPQDWPRDWYTLDHYWREHAVLREFEHHYRLHAGDPAAPYGLRVFSYAARDSALDWFVVDTDRLTLEAVCELKVRDMDWLEYPTVFLSEAKERVLRRARPLLDVPGLFVVRTRDALAWVDVEDIPQNAERRAAGRTDRGKAGDIEPVVLVPCSVFTVVPYPALTPTEEVTP